MRQKIKLFYSFFPTTATFSVSSHHMERGNIKGSYLLLYIILMRQTSQYHHLGELRHCAGMLCQDDMHRYRKGTLSNTQ